MNKTKLTNVSTSNTSEGFTLIELLVVVAIISLLSSIIFASLNGARTKVRVSKHIQELEQFSKVMALEYSDKGTYAGLYNGDWVPSPSAYTCDTFYGPSSGKTSAYLANANSICKALVANDPGGLYSFIATGTADKFTLNAWLYPESLLYCIGSSGKKFATPLSDPNAYNYPGCYNNP